MSCSSGARCPRSLTWTDPVWNEMTACDATTDAVAKQVCVNYSDSCPLRYPCSPSRQGWMHSIKGLIGAQGCRQGDASTDLRPANADEYDLVVHTKEEELGTRRRVPNEDLRHPRVGLVPRSGSSCFSAASSHRRIALQGPQNNNQMARTVYTFHQHTGARASSERGKVHSTPSSECRDNQQWHSVTTCLGGSQRYGLAAGRTCGKAWHTVSVRGSNRHIAQRSVAHGYGESSVG